MNDLVESLEKSAASGERLQDLDLRAQDLTRARLCGLTANSIDLSGAQLENADLSRATLRLCTFDRVQGTSINLDDARLEDSSAEAADFSRATLRRAHLTETSFSRGVLRGAVLDNAEGDGVEFRGADLRGASLLSVRFDEADFRGADLRGADLSKGRFHSADFRGALLEGATFHDADCANAWFDQGEGPSAAPPPKTDAKSAAAIDELLHSLPAAFASLAPGLVAQMQRLGEKLSSDEAPEEWKPWLEPLMKLSGGKPNLDKIAVELGKMKPEDVRVWLDSILGGAKKPQ